MPTDRVVGIVLARNSNVVVAGDAKSTMDFFQVKLNVLTFFFAQLVVQVESQLFAARTSKSVSSPNFAQGMDTRIATTMDRDQSLAHVWIVAQMFFDQCHFVGWQSFVEVRFEIGLGEFLAQFMFPSTSC